MEISLLLLKEIVKLFLMMLMGYVIVKAKILKSEDSSVLSTVLVYLIMPCVVINSFQIEATEQVRTGLIYSFIIAVIIHILFLLFTVVFRRILYFDVIEQVSLIYPNAGILVIPLVESMFGEKYVIYSCAFIVIQMILLWTHCISRICPSQGSDWKQIFHNVNLIAIVIGAILFLFQIQLPTEISETVDSVGDMIGPVGMLLAGMVVANSPLKRIFGKGRNYLTAAFRLIVYPLLLLFIFWMTKVSGLIPDGKNILIVVYIAAITPVCAMITSMAQLYKGDAAHASALYVLTTLCSIVTMPVMIGLFDVLV